VVEARQLSGFGARRLKVEFEFPASVGAIARILRQEGLVRPRKRKHLTKQDLRAVKAAWPGLLTKARDEAIEGVFW
jgi:hypothetical protein